MQNELKPCPFCGNEAEQDYHRAYRALRDGKVGDGVAVYCTRCNAEMMLCHADHPGVDGVDLMHELVVAWNERTAALASQPEAVAGEPPVTGPDTELIYGVPHYGKLGTTTPASFAENANCSPAPPEKPVAGTVDGLLPCPFCGHPATLNSVAGGAAIECSGCGAEVVASADETGKLLWNSRVPAPSGMGKAVDATHRHRKRGTTYVEIGRGELQSDFDVAEGERLVVYQCTTDGRFWFRPESEFDDGRFEALSALKAEEAGS